MGRENVWPENWDVDLPLPTPCDKACCKVLFLSCRGSPVEKQMPQPIPSSPVFKQKKYPRPYFLGLEERIHNRHWLLVPLRTYPLCGQQEGRAGEGKEKRKLLAL